jgi:hypothetical protein
MNIVRYVGGLALSGLVVMTGLTQAPASSKKLSSDEMLSRRVAECSTYEESDEPDECVRLGNTTAQSLLSDSLSWLNIPSGIALPSNDAGNSRFTYHPADLSIRGILDSIVAADPRYEWSIKGGVINLLPKVESPPLLDVHLAEFSQEEVPVRVMFEALENRPEVRRRAAELGFSKSQGGFEFQIGLVDTRKYTVRCQNCTVREALNAIARQSGGFWVYREYNHEGNKTYRFL